MRVLGVDPGGKRIGLAVADLETGIVTPLDVIAYRGRDRAAALIATIVAAQDAGLVVIGLPTDAAGAETPACARSRALVSALAELGVEAELQPELLSTDEARRRARATGRPSSAPVDDLAAAVILEDFISIRPAGGPAT
jgi:putative Holliday junction resolvase